MAEKKRMGLVGRFLFAVALFFKLIFNGRLALLVKNFATDTDDVLDSSGDRDSKVAKNKTVEHKPAQAKSDTPAVDPNAVALAFLAALQRDGRFIDFISESLEGFSDAQVGAVAREIHGNCKKVVDRYVDLNPVWPVEEESQVVVESGFDPARVQLSGNVVGDPPFRGVLRHRGWMVSNFRPPRLTHVNASQIIAPAEVEV